MKIDATRYNLFWSNPEKYRLREIWKLAPKEPATGTFASLLTYGRRRGLASMSCSTPTTGRYPVREARIDLDNGGFGEKEIGAAERMFWAVKERSTPTSNTSRTRFYSSTRFLIHRTVWSGALTTF
jgi:hypothetical protein